MFDNKRKAGYKKMPDGTVNCFGELHSYVYNLRRWYAEDFEVKETRDQTFFLTQYVPHFTLHLAGQVHYASHSLNWDNKPLFGKKTKAEDLVDCFKNRTIHNVILRAETWRASPGDRVEVEISFNPWDVLCFLADNLPKGHFQFAAPDIRLALKYRYQPKTKPSSKRAALSKEARFVPQVESNTTCFLRALCFQQQLDVTHAIAEASNERKRQSKPSVPRMNLVMK